MAEDLATSITAAAGQPATIRIGVVAAVSPLQISLGGTMLDMASVGMIDGANFTVGSPVVLLGQSVQGGATSGASWVALGNCLPAV